MKFWNKGAGFRSAAKRCVVERLGDVTTGRDVVSGRAAVAVPGTRDLECTATNERVCMAGS